jgi:hypothetical protein
MTMAGTSADCNGLRRMRLAAVCLAASLASGCSSFATNLGAINPLAPDWQVEQTRLDTDRIRISLRKNVLASGGEGEAAQLFARRAEQLAHAGHYAGYTVLEYTEGIDSTLPLAQRVAQGVIELNR